MKGMKAVQQIIDERITPSDLREGGVRHVLDKIRAGDGYYITNTERDLSIRLQKPHNAAHPDSGLQREK